MCLDWANMCILEAYDLAVVAGCEAVSELLSAFSLRALVLLLSKFFSALKYLNIFSHRM